MIARRLAALACLIVSAAASAGEDARAQFKRFLAEVHGFEAVFEQQVFDETGKPTETSSGRVAVSRPGRFDWDYRQPYQQRIVSDGKTLWVYDADLAQLTVNAVRPGAADSPARLLGDDFNLDEAFQVDPAPDADGLAWLHLRPRSAQPQFSEVWLGLREGRVAAMRLKDNLGQVTALRFSELVPNPALPAARFQFEPPPGTDVIHGMGD